MKTAEELGIKQWELNRLIDVKRHLENDTLKEQSIHFDINYPSVNIMSWVYNSNTTERAKEMREENIPECGSACCIGGSMFALEFGQRVENSLIFSRQEAADYVWSSHALETLFFPDKEISNEMVWKFVTKERAARAVGNVLETGEPNWTQIFADDGIEFPEDDEEEEDEF